MSFIQTIWLKKSSQGKVSFPFWRKVRKEKSFFESLEKSEKKKWPFSPGKVRKEKSTNVKKDFSSDNMVEEISRRTTTEASKY